MADIELIVKIDANVYTRLFDNGIQDNEIETDDICEMARSLRQGTPLLEKPKMSKDEAICQTSAIINRYETWNKVVFGNGIVEIPLDAEDMEALKTILWELRRKDGGFRCR